MSPTCGCDSAVSDEVGNSGGVGVVDVSSDDAVRVCGWLSVVGDTLMCGAGVARSDREEEWRNVVGWTGSFAETVPFARATTHARLYLLMHTHEYSISTMHRHDGLLSLLIKTSLIANIGAAYHIINNLFHIIS